MINRNLFIVALLACALMARAQGTIQFNATLTATNEVPPNSDPTIAIGTFSLDGTTLNFNVMVPAVTFLAMSAYIQGPAAPGVNGPIIFDLGGPSFIGGSPQFGIPPYYDFFSPSFGPVGAGPFTLTSDQINQLESGLWYVNVTSSSFPNGILRGQIIQVPEPASLSLLLLSGLIVLFKNRRCF